jgi:hypothetical protein
MKPLFDLPDYKALKGPPLLSCTFLSCSLPSHRPHMLISNVFFYSLTTGQRLRLNNDDALLCLYLTDLLSFFVSNHGHRSQYFILSGPMNTKVGSLLTAREKPLRHGKIAHHGV